MAEAPCDTCGCSGTACGSVGDWVGDGDGVGPSSFRLNKNDMMLSVQLGESARGEGVGCCGPAAAAATECLDGERDRAPDSENDWWCGCRCLSVSAEGVGRGALGCGR